MWHVFYVDVEFGRTYYKHNIQIEDFRHFRETAAKNTC
jgi:hypothetical protein